MFDAQKYHEFIKNKHVRFQQCGFDADESLIPDNLFDWQRKIVLWACAKGKAAIFASCGLGKTAMQLSWALQVVKHTGQSVIILAPLAVGSQTVQEGVKFGIEAQTIRKMDDISKPGIYIINYEMIDHINPYAFGGVVLDESSILKAMLGKTRNALIDMFCKTPYRLCCTATPAPNDHTELGNHAEFLGIMRYQEMLSIWFINDGAKANSWRLKGHAKDDFWSWVSTWAVNLQKPSDIGPEFDDSKFALPDLITEKHILPDDGIDEEHGTLIRMSNASAINIKKDMRRTLESRVAEAARIVSQMDASESVIVWCELNEESTALTKAIPGAVEITGSMKPDEKERRMMDFTSGKIRILVSKPKICGFGMNWQHCHQMIFVGMSFSFESRYQAIRRCWRFGQSHTVHDHIILAGQETKIFSAIQKKEQKYVEMEHSMSGKFHNELNVANTAKRKYTASRSFAVPQFCQR